MINIDVPDMLSDKEAAKLFGLPKKLIRAKARSGEIVAIQDEGNYFINVEMFAEYLRTHREAEPPASTTPITNPKPQAQESDKVLGIRPVPLKLRL